MKRCFAIISFLCTVISYAQNQNYEDLIINNAAPEQGSIISFTYKGELAYRPETSLTLYYIVNNQLFAKPVITSTSKSIKGSFKLPAAALSFAMVFRAGQSFDINDNDCYVYNVFNNKIPIKGSFYSSSLFYSYDFARILCLSPNLELANRLIEREFDLYPNSRLNYKLTELFYKSELHNKVIIEKELPSILTVF